MSIESVAGTILQRGITLDNEKRFTEALVCFQEGLQILLETFKKETDVTKKKYLRSKIEEYMNQAELIKNKIAKQKDDGNFHEQIHIDANSTGHSYKQMFGRFLDDEVMCVRVEDPYIRTFHQCQNFLRLCELLVQSCKNLSKIYLTTSHENETAATEQMKWFQQLTDDLKKFKIDLNVTISSTLHDRQIRLSSGWIIKIGRGLDFYKPPVNKFSLGMYDLDLRPCHETTIDIFHTKDVKHVF